MSKSRADLIRNVLSRLSVIEGQAIPSAEDSQNIDDTISTVFRDLEARFVVPTLSDTQIPYAMFNYLTDIIADVVSFDYGVIGAEKTQLAADATDGENKLRAIARIEPRPLANSQFDPALWPRRLGGYGWNGF